MKEKRDRLRAMAEEVGAVVREVERAIKMVVRWRKERKRLQWSMKGKRIVKVMDEIKEMIEDREAALSC